MTSPALKPAETIKEEFTAGFQRQILALMYSDPNFLQMVADVIKPEHFEEEVDSAYARIFLNFAKKYPTEHISKEVVFNEIGKLVKLKKIEDDARPLYVKAFIQIATAPASAGYIRNEIQRFVLAKSIEVELIASVELMKKGRYKEIVDGIVQTYSKVESAEKKADIQVVGGVKDRVIVLKDPDAAIAKNGITTGSAKLDTHLYRQGTGPGEMIVVCGSPGRGKSIVLTNFGLAGIMTGHNGLCYTLEVAGDIYLNRIDAAVTGIPFVDLIKYASVVEERWNIIKSHYKLGEIYLQDLPPRYLTPNMIRRHLTWYRNQGIEISFVIVDYADIMASDRKIDDRRLEHGDVYEQLRGVGKEFGVAMLTASQANRDSLRKKEVDIDSMAEDFSKAMTADYVIGLSQTKIEEASRDDGRGTGTLRLFIAKNRNGPKGIAVEYMTDFTKMRLDMHAMDKFDVEHFGKLIR